MAAKRRKAAARPTAAPALVGSIARRWSVADRQIAQLNAWANQLEGLWWNATPQVRARFIDGRPLRGCQMSDKERLAIAAFFRRLAKNPAALEALDGERKRGRPNDLTRDYCLALDYLATKERLGKSEAALREVQCAWGNLSRSTVLRAHRRSTLAQYRRAGRNYKADPVSAELERIERANPDMTRGELLLAVSHELRKNKAD